VSFGELVGRFGRVTDTIPAGGVHKGEVMIDGQAYHALATDTSQELPRGTRITVVEYEPPRTVVVTPF
jgi:membrane protein implicated in regulation of membrane protease activity